MSKRRNSVNLEEPGSNKRSRHNNTEYTVGWICAISTEYVAAQSFLDEEHEGPDFVPPNDHNDYALGKIGGHNVVIAVLPDGEYGTSSAAAVAKDLLRTFPTIRIGLIVGIAGGAPSKKHDIRLGDIIVSAPRGGKGGVFQYDFGKTIQDQAFRTTGFLNQPPVLLRTAVSGLATVYERKGHKLTEAIDGVLEQNIRLRQKYKRPDQSTDRLYKSNIVHISEGEASCTAVCGDDPSKLIIRPERNEDDDIPAIHYGLIASANQLMKDAIIRDNLAAEKDVLCFEMEAAGLMNQFPSIVIRSICDYSDSHKNQEWQGYAAMAAAAYAKDLLCRIAPNKIEEERRIAEVLESVETISKDTNDDVKYIRSEVMDSKILRWLSPPDPSINYHKALRQRHEGSGSWFLNSDEYSSWKIKRNSFLWLHGLTGCGKTILSSSIIHDLIRTCQRPIYFFFDFTDTSKQTLENMLRALISQLFQEKITSEQLGSLYSSCQEENTQPTCESLRETFLQMSKQFGEIWIVIDALDECHTRSTTSTDGVLAWIADVLKGDQSNIHILVTSRPENDIKCGITDFASPDDILPIEGSIIADDINAYIYKRVRTGGGLKRWRSHPDVREEMENELIKKSNGMFRWAACQLDTLETCLDYPSLKEALISLPETLEETYSRILCNIPKNCRQKATRILQFLTWSPDPLRIDEMIDAITVDLEGEEYFNPKHRMPDYEEILNYCSNLVVLVPGSSWNFAELRLSHLSVKEYLISTAHKGCFMDSFQHEIANRSNAMVCLAYLLHLNPDVQWSKFDAWAIGKVDDRYPFAGYCARNWSKFARVAENANKQLQEMILKLLCSSKASYRHSVYFTETASVSGWVPPLYFAAQEGLLKTAEGLINLGADINEFTGHHAPCGNALTAASSRGHYKMVELLLSHGAEINVEFENPIVELGQPFGSRYIILEFTTALQAACNGGDIKTVSLLLDRGARINSRDGRSSLALKIASWRGCYEIVKLLLDRDTGVDIDADNKGYRYGIALTKASFAGHYETARLLLDRGADVNTQVDIHGTALQAAVNNIRPTATYKIVQLLLKHGADINFQSENFAAALYVALNGGIYDVVELLLDSGASVKSSRGWCVDHLDSAFSEGLNRVVQRQIKALDNNDDGGSVIPIEVWRGNRSKDPELARLKLLASRIAKMQGYHAGGACPKVELRRQWWWPVNAVAA